MCFPLGFGATGLWLGLIAGSAVAIVLMTSRFRRRLAQAEINLDDTVPRAA
jgi:Na+-driven multidrug efflux pump